MNMQKSPPLPALIFVTGGVISSLGKGLTSAGIAHLLEARGYRIGMMKLDPYFNVDPGTMSPYQHGEVYVTDDGAETDLDLGHYHRCTNAVLSKENSTSSGQIFQSVIEKEREGAYQGQTVQMIPHVTEEIQKRILACAQKDPIDLLLVEIGGTAGDIESLPFLEAIRQLSQQEHLACLSIHMTYVPYVKAAKEIKTKPTQHSVQQMRSIGLFPNILICRSEKPLDPKTRDKIALFCNLPSKAVFVAPDVEKSIYEVPLDLYDEGVDHYLLEELKLEPRACEISRLRALLASLDRKRKRCKIALVGKYIEHDDAYKSIYEALAHASLHEEVEIELEKISPEELIDEEQEKSEARLKSCDGVLIPGGFGERGWRGKLRAVTLCREGSIPYFGICLGMQALCVEFARSCCALPRANSAEFLDKSAPDERIIDLMEEQKRALPLGGTMRLGRYHCLFQEDSRLHEIYKSDHAWERHRHRYELNQSYIPLLESKGLRISGRCDGAKQLAEAVELCDHPFMVGVQFHPEFTSKLLQPHPLFVAFLRACLARKEQKGGSS